jgi:hypothetical protein
MNDAEIAQILPEWRNWSKKEKDKALAVSRVPKNVR